MFSSIWATINRATDEGFVSVGDWDADFKNAIKNNNAVFAAFKTHRLQSDVAAQLLDADGNLKSFSQWETDTQGIVDHQVGHWLETEYNTAVTRAHQAADWRQFLREEDILPNLRWNPSTSITPGLDHTVFWNRIWSIRSKFWDDHRPGDRWGCKCSLSSTDEPETDNSDIVIDDYPPAPGLAGNPGETAKLFSDDHPYMAEAHKGAEKAVKKLLNDVQAEPEKLTEKSFKSGGVIQKPEGFSQNKQEQKKNIAVYTELAKYYGDRYRLLSVDNMPGIKNPDALNLRTGYKSDAKVPTTDNGKNAIQSSIKAATKQGVEEVYIYLEKKYSRYSIYAGLKASLQKGRAKSLKTIIIRFEDGEVKRYNVDKIRKVFK